MQGNRRKLPKTASVDTAREIEELELALLRRGLDERLTGSERCGRCQRTPLIGERVYLCGEDRVLCELCRELESGGPFRSRLVHGPAFGHTIRIIDQRAA